MNHAFRNTKSDQSILIKAPQTHHATPSIFQEAGCEYYWWVCKVYMLQYMSCPCRSMSAPPHQTKTTNITLIRRQEPDALYVTEGFVARMNPGSTQAERESTAPYVAWWPTGALQLFACGESPTMQRLTVTNTMPLPSLQLFTTLPVRSPIHM
jgi:hypothetical protein